MCKVHIMNEWDLFSGGMIFLIIITWKIYILTLFVVPHLCTTFTLVAHTLMCIVIVRWSNVTLLLCCKIAMHFYSLNRNITPHNNAYNICSYWWLNQVCFTLFWFTKHVMLCYVRHFVWSFYGHSIWIRIRLRIFCV